MTEMNLAGRLRWIFAILCLALLNVALAAYLFKGLTLVLELGIHLIHHVRAFFVAYDSLLTAIDKLLQIKCK